MADCTHVRATEHRVTRIDIANLLGGEGGVDLRPVIEDGKQIGMRVVGVTPGSTAARLGAVDDDFVESIDETELTGIGAAYAAGRAASARGDFALGSGKPLRPAGIAKELGRA
jgi:hypothetical protein